MDAHTHFQLWGFYFTRENTFHSEEDAEYIRQVVSENRRYNHATRNGSLRCNCQNDCSRGCPNKRNGFECTLGNCSPRCVNNELQMLERGNRFAPMTIKYQPKLGLALYSTQDLARNEFLGEIKGKYQTFPADKPTTSSFHMYELQQYPSAIGLRCRKITLDTRLIANEFHYLQHSHTPNCNIYQWKVGNQIRLKVRTNQEVPADTPLSINYGNYYFTYDMYCLCPACPPIMPPPPPQNKQKRKRKRR